MVKLLFDNLRVRFNEGARPVQDGELVARIRLWFNSGSQRVAA
jgi:hypothetical protein